jgi:hypothetical protein
MVGWQIVNWKGFGRKRSLPNRGTIPAFVWRNWGKPPKTSVKMSRCPGRHSNREHPNCNQHGESVMSLYIYLWQLSPLCKWRRVKPVVAESTVLTAPTSVVARAHKPLCQHLLPWDDVMSWEKHYCAFTVIPQICYDQHAENVSVKCGR